MRINRLNMFTQVTKLVPHRCCFHLVWGIRTRSFVHTSQNPAPNAVTERGEKFNGNHAQDEFFQRILQRFPAKGRSLTFAYGSAVFQQANRTDTNRVTDIVMVVDDSESWHRENLMRNRSDYAGILKLMGPKLIASNQDKWGGRFHFNTLVPFEDGLIKYGIISKNAFFSDCLDWETLYAAGRLHKPVKILQVDPKHTLEYDTTLRLNLQSALHTALLILPETFTEEELYLKLAGLSYSGDFRMIVGEDRNKVSNIVRPNLVKFRQLYANRINALSEYLDLTPSPSGVGIQDSSPSSRHFHLSQLPKTVQLNLVMEWSRDGRYRDVEEVLRAAAYDRDSDALITRSLQRINQRSSITQAIKGVIAAGFCKTIRYSWSKLQKMLKSLKSI